MTKEFVILQKTDLSSADFDNNDTNGQGGVKVKVSKYSGNLIQKRADGLYYGVTPPPNLTFLYVDAVNGEDVVPTSANGAGSREKPFKTISFATSQMMEGTVTHLYLMENQEHIVDANRSAAIQTKELTIRTYGPINDQYVPDGSNLTVLAQRGIQAKIVLTGVRVTTPNHRKDQSYVSFGALYLGTGSKVEFLNVEIIQENGVEVRAANETATNLTSIVSFPRINLEGTVIFNYCKFLSRGTTRLVGFTNLGATTIHLNVDESGIGKVHGLNFIPLIGARSLSDTNSVVFSNVRGWDFNNVVIQDIGWGYNGFVSLSRIGGGDVSKITEAILPKTLMALPNSKDKILVQPRTDIDHHHFI